MRRMIIALEFGHADRFVGVTPCPSETDAPSAPPTPPKAFSVPTAPKIATIAFREAMSRN